MLAQNDDSNKFVLSFFIYSSKMIFIAKMIQNYKRKNKRRRMDKIKYRHKVHRKNTMTEKVEKKSFLLEEIENNLDLSAK